MAPPPSLNDSICVSAVLAAAIGKMLPDLQPLKMVLFPLRLAKALKAFPVVPLLAGIKVVDQTPASSLAAVGQWLA